MYYLSKDGMQHDLCRDTKDEAIIDLNRAYSYYSRQERVVSMTDIKDNMFGIECIDGKKHTFAIYEV